MEVSNPSDPQLIGNTLVMAGRRASSKQHENVLDLASSQIADVRGDGFAD
jgi:hypothetical protein